VHQAEATSGLIDALAVAGRIGEVVDEAQRLGELADALASVRFARVATFWKTASSDGGLDPAVLESLAAAAGAGPSARRARALLGGDPRLDEIDHMVLAEVMQRGGWRTPERIGADVEPGSWSPGWGLDERTRHVWLPDGRRIDLSTRPQLFGLLETIASHGGAAKKEQIVTAIWEEPDYHPLRHDNRLHASIRKLRRAIEDDHTTPTRILTTDTGYAFGAVVRRIRA